jgi:hypothetical protein
MRGFLITLLALPAALAVPAPAPASDAWPTEFPISTVMCRCSDGGSRNTIGSCLYFGQQLDTWVRDSHYSILIFVLINYSKPVLPDSLLVSTHGRGLHRRLL